MARRPRRWREDAVYAEVKRTVDRQFLLKPTPEVRNIIGACLGRALQKYPVQLHWAASNTTHFGVGRSALPGMLDNLSRFNQYFYGLLSRELNKLWGREGPMWSTRSRSAEAIDDDAAEDRLFYEVTNMVKDGLVDRVTHSEGFNCYGTLATGEKEKFWYLDWTSWWNDGGPRNKKPVSEYKVWVEVEYTPLPKWRQMTPDQRQAHFRREVRKIEQEARKEREREGRPVMGPQKLAKLDPRDRPKTEAKSGPQPLCHASTKEAAEEYKKEFKVFLDHYYRASGLYREGHFDVEFPEGSFRPPLVTIYCASSL